MLMWRVGVRVRVEGGHAQSKSDADCDIAQSLWPRKYMVGSVDLSSEFDGKLQDPQ